MFSSTKNMVLIKIHPLPGHRCPYPHSVGGVGHTLDRSQALHTNKNQLKYKTIKNNLSTLRLVLRPGCKKRNKERKYLIKCSFKQRFHTMC